MLHRTSYAPGVPCWVELGATRLDEAAKFYGELFGWRLTDGGVGDEDCGLFTVGDDVVAALSSPPDSSVLLDSAGSPAWSVYLSTDDLELSVRTAESAGGRTVVEPVSAGPSGSLAVVADPLGARYSLWMAAGRYGLDLTNEPGAFCWAELATPDPQRSREFYQAALGWGCIEPEGHPAGTFTADGKVIAGSHLAADGEAVGWIVWFAVADCDEAATRAESLGGSVVQAPHSREFGRGAIIVDSSGAVFGVAQLGE